MRQGLFGKEDERITRSQGPIVEIPLDWHILRTICRHLQPPMLLQHINVSEPQCWVHWTIHYPAKPGPAPAFASFGTYIKRHIEQRQPCLLFGRPDQTRVSAQASTALQ